MTENKKTIEKYMEMTRVRVESFCISLDGYGAWPDQGVDNPLGVGGEDLHDWIISTRSWRQMHGKEGAREGSMTISLSGGPGMLVPGLLAGTC